MLTRSGTTEAYDKANRLIDDGAVHNVWSNADRLTTRGTDTFTYDPLDRLTNSTVAGTARVYTYNGDGLLQTRTGGVAASFLWDPSTSPSRELKQGNDNIIYGLGPLYVVKADATTLTFARDGSKNVRAELNGSGAVTASFRYRAYGQLAQLTNTAPTYLGLASQLLDPSGLYYMRARWYDPANGRFITRDPLRGSPLTPSSLNSFAYAGANPALASDPTGLAATIGDQEGGGCDLHCVHEVALKSNLDRCQSCAQFLASPAVQATRDAFLALPDSARPDYLKVQGGFENPFGVYTAVTLDRYGNLYVQPIGAAIGTPGAFGSITVGWLVTGYKPSESEVRSFLSGQSYSGGGALGAAVDWTWSPNASGAQHAVEVGIGSPRGGVSVGTSYWATQLPFGW
ncbi:MAG: RHS repeat-associated core domain-containing protein [Chloroflexota bacterium]|nr:RHS repeat-associated core domain-containing protein [Chloroflexota bacterium]